MHFICWAVSPREIRSTSGQYGQGTGRGGRKSAHSGRAPPHSTSGTTGHGPQSLWVLSPSSTRARAFGLDFLKDYFKIEGEQEYPYIHIFFKYFEGWYFWTPASNLWGWRVSKKMSQAKFNLVFFFFQHLRICRERKHSLKCYPGFHFAQTWFQT